MDRRWAPAGAAVAVVALVAAVALVLSGDDEPGRVATLPTPPSATASATAQPSPPEDAPAVAPSAPAARPSPTAPAATEPDSPVGSDDEPTAAPAPAPTRTTAPTPAPAPSTAPQPSPDTARSAFPFDAAYGTDEPGEVVVQYGDSSSCPHTNVRHTVRESADRVVVTLEADAMDPGRACTADYRQRLVPVRLQQPLGDRVLVDGSRDEPVAVDRSCNRPFGNPPPPKDCTP